MNPILLVAAAGVLAQVSGPDVHLPLCDALDCPGWGDPVKSESVEGQLQMPARWTAADVLRALESASPRARCIVRAEVGGVGFSPWAVGRQGERGPVQLLPQRGLLSDYTRWSGGRPPEDPYWSIRYLDHMLATGRGGNWSSVSAGRC